MRSPNARGTPITTARRSTWLSRFKFYRDPPDDRTIDRWLSLFEHAHRDLAARILDSVEVVSERRIQTGYNAALSKLDGWSPYAKHRRGRWVFVGFGLAGESGPSMLRVFREANNLSSATFDPLFCSLTELPSKQLTAEDHIVFVDDFSGTGSQACRMWPIVQELIASEAKCYLILTAATSRALEKIRGDTSLNVRTQIVLRREDNVFDAYCRHFSPAERSVLVDYGRIADHKQPRGYGACGLLFVLSHKTPNNTLPILHANKRRWRGLFPRYLNPAT